MPDAVVKSLAPILVVDAIEPSLPFWAAVGFQTTMTVPEQSPYVFAIVASSAIEIMLQTRASVLDDTPAVAASVDRLGPVYQRGVAGADPGRPAPRTGGGATPHHVLRCRRGVVRRSCGQRHWFLRRRDSGGSSFLKKSKRFMIVGGAPAGGLRHEHL